MDANCGQCHSIASENITATMMGLDLDKVGKSRDAEWIAQFLQRKVKANDKAHPLPWGGTDEQLSLIADWLASLK